MLVGRYVLSYVFFASICRISICVYVVGVVCMCMHILYTYACWIVCHMNFPPIRPLSICIYIVVSLFVFVFVCVTDHCLLSHVLIQFGLHAQRSNVCQSHFLSATKLLARNLISSTCNLMLYPCSSRTLTRKHFRLHAPGYGGGGLPS